MGDGRGGRYGDLSRVEMVDFIPIGARRVLDVGCFAGAFGELLAARCPGVEVWGIEPDPDAAAAAAQRLHRVVCGTFPGDVPAGEEFDVIVFNDVLEHMIDPWSALAAATALLSADGRVVASIPNVRHFSVSAALVLHGRWRYHRSGILDRTHLRFFTRYEIHEMFREAGLPVEQCERISLTVPASPIGWILRWMGQLGADFLNAQFAVVGVPSH